jgi:SNF2 family DNA or RNA helicase
MSDADVVVINFENLPWLFKQSLVKIRMNGLVIDELTKLKNSTSARFKALYKARNQFKIRWGLTGSFTSNGLVDVFGQCKIIDDCYLGKTITGFLNNYFYGVSKGYYTDWTPKPNAVDKVMDVIYPMTFALENKSYKDNLPLLHIVPVSIDMSQSVQHVYAQMVKTSVLYADDMKTELKMTAPSAAVLVQKLQQISAGFYYDDTHVAHWISKDKIDRIEEIIEANQHAPTIIFYQYTAEYEALKARFPQIKTLMQKQESYTINDWNAGKIPILLLHPKSAGHGLNLQHGGGHIIFTSPVWSMEEYEQCIGRLHRSGQTRDVWVYVLMCKNSVDERIFNEVLPGKIAIADLAKECLTNAKENPIYPNPCSE